MNGIKGLICVLLLTGRAYASGCEGDPGKSAERAEAAAKRAKEAADRAERIVNGGKAPEKKPSK